MSFTVAAVNQSRRPLRCLFSALLVLAAVPGAQAAGDAAAGKTKAVVCGACHGADGNAIMPIYPHLAGQSAPYLESALHAYKAGQRTSANAAMMTPMAANLSEQDMADLAAYFASQKLKQQ